MPDIETNIIVTEQAVSVEVADVANTEFEIIESQVTVSETVTTTDIETVDLSYAVETTAVVSEIEIVEAGQQGPPGPPGSSGAQVFSATAGTPLSGQRAVRLVDDRAFYCDGNNPAHVGSCVGITETAASAEGQIVNIRAMGRMEYSGWSWVGGPVFVGASGLLSALPGTAFTQEIARVDSSTRITVGIRLSVLKG